MMPIKKITITRAEGPANLCGKPETFASFDEATRWLYRQSSTFPETGGYDKHDFTIVWEDERTYTGRLDCTRAGHRDNDLDLRAHVIQHASFYGGMLQYPIMGRMGYHDLIMDAEKRHPGTCESYRDLLVNYLFDPTPESIGPFCARCHIVLTADEQQHGSICTYCHADDAAALARTTPGATFVRLFIDGPDVEPDDHDREIAIERLTRWDRDPDPRIGDYVILSDGSYVRFAHIWDDVLQTTDCGSFYLGNGYVSMSGGLDPGVPPEQVVLTPEKKPGYFWFFHHNAPMGGGGVGLEAMCRVYTVQPLRE
jgi:hypothetical protein